MPREIIGRILRVSGLCRVENEQFVAVLCVRARGRHGRYGYLIRRKNTIAYREKPTYHASSSEQLSLEHDLNTTVPELAKSLDDA